MKKVEKEKEPPIPYRDYTDVFDICSADTFGDYYTRFYTIHYFMSTLEILFAAATAILQTPVIFSDPSNQSRIDLGIVSLVLGFSASALGTILHVSKFATAAKECNDARTEILYYLATQRPMPKHTFTKINSASTLCYRHPTRCDDVLEKQLERAGDATGVFSSKTKPGTQPAAVASVTPTPDTATTPTPSTTRSRTPIRPGRIVSMQPGRGLIRSAART